MKLVTANKLAQFWKKGVKPIKDALEGKAATDHEHDGRYYTEDEVDTKLEGKAASTHSHDGSYYTKTEVDTKVNGRAAASHSHDDRYYTESEVTSLLGGKAASTHYHDDRYYTESEVNSLVNGRAAASHSHSDINAHLSRCITNETNGNANYYSVSRILKDAGGGGFTANTGLGVYCWSGFAYSDKRIKQNIRPSEVNALSIIKAIQHRAFDFVDPKFGKHSDLGYVAQELMELIPEAVVSVPQDTEILGYSEVCQIDYLRFVPYLTKAVQELMEKIEKLEETATVGKNN